MKDFNKWLALWEEQLNFRLEKLEKFKDFNHESDYFYARTALREFNKELKGAKLQKGFKPLKKWEEISKSATEFLDAYKTYNLDIGGKQLKEPDFLTPHRFGRV